MGPLGLGAKYRALGPLCFTAFLLTNLINFTLMSSSFIVFIKLLKLHSDDYKKTFPLA